MWQEKPPIIVIVTNLKEGNKVKCQQYWPEAGASQYCTFKFDKFVYVYICKQWLEEESCPYTKCYQP